MSEKIATCSYCGTRAALVLGGTTQHELACATCGAPLHDLRALKAEKPKKSGKSAKKQKKAKKPPHTLDPVSGWSLPGASHAKKRVTRKLQRKIAKKALGALADLFD